MQVVLRPGRPSDAEACGRICYEAFKAIAESHGFPPDFPNEEFATHVIADLLCRAGVYSVVAETGGELLGSNFLDERNTIAGIGPITVDPAAQDAAIGRRLMEHTLARVRERQFPGVRLCQAAYDNRSLALYAKLGFAVREPLSTLQGPPPVVEIAGTAVRQARPDDLAACNALCERVHGHDRAGELSDAIKSGRVSVVEREGRISVYSSAIAYFGHSVALTNEDLKALIGAAKRTDGPGLLIRSRNSELLEWGFANGLRLVQQMTLMTIGFYQEPKGAYLPSVFY